MQDPADHKLGPLRPSMHGSLSVSYAYRVLDLTTSWPVLRVDGAFVFRQDGWIDDRW